MDIGEPMQILASATDETGGALEFNLHVSLLSQALHSCLDHISLRPEGQETETDNGEGTAEYSWNDCNYAQAELPDDVYTAPILPNGYQTPPQLIIRQKAAEVMTQYDFLHLYCIEIYIRLNYPEYSLPGRNNRSLMEILVEICGPEYWKPQVTFFPDHNLRLSEECIEGVLPTLVWVRCTRNHNGYIQRLQKAYIFLNTEGTYICGRWVGYNSLLAFMSFIYSVAHLSTWNVATQDNTARVFFRAACILAAVFVLSIYLLNCLLVYYKRKPTETLSERSQRWDGRWSTIWVLLFCGSIPRLVITILSFTSLRSSPIGVFWTPAWIQMIPHG